MKRKKSRKNKKMDKELRNYVSIIFIVIVIVASVLLIKNINLGGVISNIIEDTKDEEVVEEKKIQIVDLDSNSRNVAVMINNVSTVWGYQSGIQDAYILYEMIVEGGITRLMGIFRDVNLDRIGTVRSARPYYLDYALENDAIYIHVGGSPEALSDIKTLGVNDLESYYRDSSIGLSYEHTAFTSTSLISEKASNKGYRTTSDTDLLFNYSIDEIDLSTMEGATTANNVSIKFSSSKSTSFVYDAENKVYKRYQNNKEHTDYVTKEQYTVKNIITYQVYNYTSGKKGRQTLNNIGSGTGYLITDGYAVPITWEKSSRSSQTIYKYLNGEEITLNDGNTHIEIQPKGLSLEIS